MAKEKAAVPPITTLTKYLKKETFLPIYFFFGDDFYSIEKAIEHVESKVKPHLSSDFDKESFQGKDISIIELMDISSSFPFGSEYKLIIVKNFEKIKSDKKSLPAFASYVNNPSPSTILIISNEGEIEAKQFKNEPFKSLLEKNYIFEATEPKGAELNAWIIRCAARSGKIIDQENAQVLADMVGENRALIEMQIEKMLAYLGNEKNITYEIIKKVASNLKEFTIFELLNAIGNRDKFRAMEVANNLFDKSPDEDRSALIIMTMLTKYFTSIAGIPEIEKNFSNKQEKARLAGVHHFFYDKYLSAANYYRGKKLIDVTRALFEADLEIKSTGADPRTIILILIARIMTPDFA